MANPGSPEQMRATQENMPAMPKGTLVSMMVVLVVMMVVMTFREQIGGALNIVFQFIDFGGQYPVLTLVIGGLLMITLSTVVRGLMSKPLEQAKTQHVQKEFNEEMRKARIENNLYKMKKLQSQQQNMMAASMKQSTDMMKLMPVTMVIIIPIYAWVWFFITNTVPSDLLVINMPWGFANLNDSVWFMPIWIVVYTLISLPIGQLENKIMSFIQLRKRLRELEAGKV